MLALAWLWVDSDRVDFAVLRRVDDWGRTSHTVRGYVRDVPDRTSAAAVQAALDSAGYAFAGAGRSWAEHDVVPVTKLPVNTRPAGAAPLPEWSWTELMQARSKPELVQLNIRLPRPLTARLNAAAAAAGVPLREYVERVLTADLTPANRGSTGPGVAG